MCACHSYRVISSPDKKGVGSSSHKQSQPASSSPGATPPLPQATAHLPSTSAVTSSRKPAVATPPVNPSSRRGGRSSSKNIPLLSQSGSSLPIRVTRSGSGYAKTPSASKVPLEPPMRITRSNTANLPIRPSTVPPRLSSSQAVMSLQDAEVVKEKTKKC